MDSDCPPARRKASDITASTTTPAQSFSDLGVPAVLVEQLSADGKTEAFPIQQDTLGDTLAGRDVLGRDRKSVV